MTVGDDALGATSLVTGAGGLLGAAVVRQLATSDDVVAVYRPGSMGSSASSGDTVVAPGSSDISRIELDLSTLDSAPRIPACETVVHLAQSPHYRSFPDAAMDVFDVNVRSTQQLLNQAVRNGAKRFVFASTGSVYAPNHVAMTESAPIADMWSQGHYAASKRASELMCSAYSKHLTVVILRFFFIYGPGQKSSMLVPRLMENVQNAKPLTLQGENGFCLNPVYVDDAARAVATACKMTSSDVINVAGPDVVTFRELGELVGSAVGVPAQFAHDAQVKPAHCIASISHMEALLGRPEVPLSDGLRRLAIASQVL